MTTSAVYLDRLQAGLAAAIAVVHPTATVVWAPSEFPRPAAADLVFACRLLSGPSAEPLGGDSVSLTTLPMAATLRVLAPVVGEAALLFASGRRFERVFASTDPTAERDAWVAAINASPPMVNAMFEPAGADAITIEALDVGDLYKLSIRGSADGLVSLVTTDTEVALAQVGDVRSWVEIQAYSSSRYPRSGAHAALARFCRRLSLPSVMDVLEEHDIGQIGSMGDPATLDALAGPTWQSRAAVTLYIAQLSLAAEPVASIARVRATLQARGASADPIPVVVDSEEP